MLPSSVLLANIATFYNVASPLMENFSFFSKNLKTYLFANDLSAKELSGQLGYGARSTVQKWIKEGTVPGATVLKLVADLMHVSMDDLMGKDLTHYIIETSGYTTSGMVADTESTIYRDNAKLRMSINHIQSVQTKLQELVADNEKVLEAVR